MNPYCIYVDDLVRSKFESLMQLSEFKIENFPLFLNSDGFLLVVKDRNETLREPNALEKQFYCKSLTKNQGKISLSSLNSASTVDSACERGSLSKVKQERYHKEKGIVITVKEVNPFSKVEESPKSSENTDGEIKVVEDLIEGQENCASARPRKEKPSGNTKNSSLRDFKIRQMKANRNKNIDIEIYTPDS